MPDPGTLNVHLSSDTEDKLATLAARTRRTRGVLVAEAIAAYVGRELAIVEGIERGGVDVRAGRVTPHDAVMRKARAIIGAARAKA